jgi:Protein of unknown function (DUF3106)
MQPIAPSRRITLNLIAALPFFLAVTPVLLAAPRGQVIRAQSAQRPRAYAAPRPAAPRPGPGPHLPEWMARHSNLSPEEQHRALENEPGFRNLPPQTQLRLHNELSQLNNMPPEQRRRLLQRNEAMEHLTPQQRQQFNGSLAQLGAFPPDRRRLVARAFHDLREMPLAQRQAMLSSDRMRGEFTDQERGTLTNLLAVEPYIPVQQPNGGTTVGH